ncbi:MAG: hypothetical protein AABY22_13125, partial [Nanoarchaeota archaeon]
MGYTHYWYVKPELDKEKFIKIVNDFKKVLPVFEQLGIKLADGMGKDKPEINYEVIRFNGLTNCGHNKRDLGIAWADKNAEGLVSISKEEKYTDEKLNPIMNGNIATVMIGNPLEWAKHSDVSEVWFAGASLKGRVCDGDCSHETFTLEQKINYEDYNGNLGYKQYKLGLLKKYNGFDFNFCKTAFKPYDLAVNVIMIIAKHHLGNDIRIRSDGTEENWKMGKVLCQKILGYGLDF